MVRRLPVALPILTLLTLAGACAHRTYPGPELPPDQVAVVVPALHNDALIVIDRVNDVDLGYFDHSVEVLPGPQRVRATVTLKRFTSKVTRVHELSFEARPGVTYTLHADWFVYGPRIRVADSHGRWVADAITMPERLPGVGAR